MPKESLVLEKPQRWDSFFDPEMTKEKVQSMLKGPLFKEMDPELFPKHLSLEGILLHDTKLLQLDKGEIVVRQGDYGSSAFLIAKGSVVVVLQPGLPPEELGRSASGKKSYLDQFLQGFKNSKESEVFRKEKKGRKFLSRKKNLQDENRVFLNDIPRVLDEQQTVSLEAGEIFGELTAISRLPRTATIFAKEDNIELIEIRWQGFRDLMKHCPSLQKRVDETYRERALDSYLRSIPIFRDLPEKSLKALQNAAQFYTFGEYSWSGDLKRLSQEERKVHFSKEETVVEEDEYPNGIFMIRAGFARLSRNYGSGHQTITYLGPGKQYGYHEVVNNWLYKDKAVNYLYTLSVLGYLHTIFLPTHVIEEYVLPEIPKDSYPKPLEEISSKGRKGIQSKLSQERLEFLTENHLFNGRHSMVIDMDRCTRCDDCVRACESAHDGNARFLRSGPHTENIMVTNACMHCADPVCLIGCPTGAIHHDHKGGGEVVINPQTCIGCGICESNCPYDAIRMVEARSPKGEFLVDQMYNPIQKATKCDLCVEQHGGPACERACPHDALLRLNLNDLGASDNVIDFLSR